MTIDELRARRKELIARREQERALRERGEGDNMAWFVLNEEIMEVNAQLRALTGGKRIGRRTVSADAAGGALEHQIAREWAQEDSAADDREDDRAICRRALRDSGKILSQRQQEVLALWAEGATLEQIGARLGICKSTAQRTLQRARERLQLDAQIMGDLARQERRVLDLAEPGAAEKLLSALTEKQAVYLYLYYGEWLSLREIMALLGLRSHTSILRSIHTALRNLGRCMGYAPLELRNLGALDDLAYEIYRALPPEALLTEGARKTVRRVQPQKPRRSGTRYLNASALPEITIREGEKLAYAVDGHIAQHGADTAQQSRLLSALLARARPGELLGMLQAVFRRLCKNNGGRARWRGGKEKQ